MSGCTRAGWEDLALTFALCLGCFLAEWLGIESGEEQEAEEGEAQPRPQGPGCQEERT